MDDHRYSLNDQPLARARSRWPVVAFLLALLQFAGFAAPLSSAVRSNVAVAPTSILREAQAWRLAAGPFVAEDAFWPAALLAGFAVFLFGGHLEVTQGVRRLLWLFIGGSIFAAVCWSIAALVWDWHRPLFTPVSMTSLAAGSLLFGLRRPFPAFLPYTIPVWVAFAAYVAAWQVLTRPSAIDLSAHFLAGLFAVLLWQTGAKTPRKRTNPRAPFVTNPPVATSPSSSTPWSADFDRKVDELLRKITESGYDSLNEDEIALLLEASQRYRGRQPPTGT